MIYGILLATAQCFICVGFGALFLYIVARKNMSAVTEALTFGDIGLVGQVLLSAFALLWNFFFPVYTALSTIVFAVGCLAYLAIALVDRKIVLRLLQYSLTVVVFAILITAMTYGKNDGLYDFWSYHHQAIKIIREHAVPFGLVNIHGRLAFGTTSYGFAALMSFWPNPGRAEMATNIACFVLLLTSLSFSLIRSRWNDPSQRLEKIFTAAAFVFIFARSVLLVYAPTANSDLPAAVFAIQSALLCLRLWSRRGLARESNQVLIYALLLVGCAAVTTKISHVIVPGFVAATLLQTLGLGVWQDKRRLLGYAALIFIIWVPPVLKTWMQSGCLVYPVKSTCFFSLPWAVSAEWVTTEKNWIIAFARGEPNLHGIGKYDWFWPLLKRYIAENNAVDWVLMAVAIATLLGLTAVASRKLSQAPLSVRQDFRFLSIFVAICFGGLIYWFLTAPDNRFAMGVFTVTFGVCVATAATSVFIVVPSLQRFRKSFYIAASAVFACVLGASPFVQDLAKFEKAYLSSEFPKCGFSGAPHTAIKGTPEPVDLYMSQLCSDLPPFCSPKTLDSGLETTKFLGHYHFARPNGHANW